MVYDKVLPGEVLTLIMTTPWSSCGTKPVLVVIIKNTNKADEAAKPTQQIQRWWMANITPFLYFSNIALYEAL